MQLEIFFVKIISILLFSYPKSGALNLDQTGMCHQHLKFTTLFWSGKPKKYTLFWSQELIQNYVLYCIVLYCIVLYCIVLHCIVLYCIVLYCINGLLTGCEGHTEKYRTAVFVQPELARAVLKDQGPVFLSMARANPVNKPFII